MEENTIMQQLSHPFVIALETAFQDHDNLYVVIKNYEGGDLRFHMMNAEMFSEAQAKFIAACVVSALEYIHKKNIIHRDVKPENLVFDERGFIHLTDFGVAKYWRSKNSDNTSGTPGYMAPEVMAQKSHSFSVDFYALGVIMCEFITGRRPYYGKNRQEIKEEMLARQAVVTSNLIRGEWSAEAIDFCNRLIQRKPESRLGHNSVAEIKQHPWFAGLNWADLHERRLTPLYNPMSLMHRLPRFWGESYSDENIHFNANDLQKLRNKEIQELFFGYDFDSRRKISFDKPAQAKRCSDGVNENNKTIVI